MKNDDLDRLLKDSLGNLGDEYERYHHQRKPQARARFLERHRRRRWAVPVAYGVTAAAVVVAAVFFGGRVTDLFADQDPSSQVAGRPGLEQTISVGGGPTDVGARGEAVWVVSPETGEVVRLDSDTNEEVARVDVGGRPEEIATGRFRVWVGDPSTGTISRIDPTTNEVVGERITVSGSESIAISVGDESVWAVVGDQLLRIHVRTGQSFIQDEAPEPLDVAVAGGFTWVLDGERGLMQFDQATGDLLDEPQAGIQPEAGEIFAGGGTIWVADTQDDTVVGFDPATGELTKRRNIPGTYVDMAFDSGALWVLSRSDGVTLLSALDPETTNSIGKDFEVPGEPVEVSSDQGVLWIALRDRGVVLRVDPSEIVEP